MSETGRARGAMFSFDPADVETDERERFKDTNRRAFESADYVPPETKSAKARASTPASAAARKAEPAPAAAPAAPEVPSFRRQRGRPSGERRYRISFKSTEPHLAALYGIAGQGELVGVFERAVELLAREVAETGRYEGRPLDEEGKAAVAALVRRLPR